MTNEGACETNPQDWKENIIPYLIEYFFKDARYLKIDGKPVFSIYSLPNWTRTFGGEKARVGRSRPSATKSRKRDFPASTC